MSSERIPLLLLICSEWNAALLTSYQRLAMFFYRWMCFALQSRISKIRLHACIQGVSETNSGVGVIPANTQLQTALSVRAATEAQKAHVSLSISTPNGRISSYLRGEFQVLCVLS